MAILIWFMGAELRYFKSRTNKYIEQTRQQFQDFVVFLCRFAALILLATCAGAKVPNLLGYLAVFLGPT